MTESSKKILWIALGIAVVLGLIWQFFPLKNAQERLARIPLSGDHFVGENVPLTDFEEKFFKNVNVLKRIYRIEGVYYFVTALDGTDNRHVVHDPYYCFTGSGWDIKSEKNIPIKNGFAKEIIITKGAQEKAALFWFSNGKEDFTSPMRYWWDATLRRFTLGWSGEEPVLIMIQPLDSVTDVDWKKITTELAALSSL